MYADIFNIREFVKLNDLKPVTRSIYLNADHTPTSDGLFSYEIFGYPGTRERNELPAYIDLKTRYIHPYIYKRWVTMDRKIASVIAGDRLWIIEGGMLKELPEDYTPTENMKAVILPSGKQLNITPGTGIQWLYTHYQRLVYQPTNSNTRSDTINLLKELKPEEVFPDCWLVQAAAYRDLDFARLGSGKIAVDEVNGLYVTLLNSIEAAERTSGLSFVSYAAQVRVQQTLVAIYDYIMGQNKGKTGITRNYILGKNIDYSSRGVISCPQVAKAEKYSDVEVKLGEIAIPLHSLCAMYRPLILRHIREIIGNHLQKVQRVIISMDLKEGVDISSETFSDSNVESMLSLFEKSQEDRFSIIYLQRDKTSKPEPLLLYHDVLKRPMTLCDLFFLAAVKAIEGKPVFFTRYPVISHLSTLPAMPKILTTKDTVRMDFTKRETGDEREGKFGYFGVIENYPDIRCSKEWRDATVINNMVTGIIDGDHDGDVISHIAVYTAEAIQEARKFVNNKTMLIKGNGNPSMTISMDCSLGLHMLTR